jgi:hypothetical protein
LALVDRRSAGAPKDRWIRAIQARWEISAS